MKPRLKVVALPRDGNPYQDLLYGALRCRGVLVRYPGEPTPSHTLNLLLLPPRLALMRAAGVRLVHLHWVFGFSLPGGPLMRRPAQFWFGVVLGVIRLLGMRLVWTAHNVLPHRQVFADDVAARRTLVRACDLVVVHTESTIDRLAELGARPARSATIAHGPFPSQPLGRPGAGHPRRFLFFGRIEEYKGVEDLLTAFAVLPADRDVQLTVAGACDDEALAARLRTLAALDHRISLRLGHVPDDDLPGLFGAADVVVLPFRCITTSGSALLALGHARPLIIPSLDSLSHLPDAAVVRYGEGVPALTRVLAEVAEYEPERIGAMSAAALAYVRRTGWDEIAQRTAEEFATVLQRRADRFGSLSFLRTRAQAVKDDALYRGSMLLLANTVSLAGFGLVFWTLAARNYSTSAVGWLASTTAAVNLLATAATLGLPNTLIRHLARTGDSRALVRTALSAVVLVGSVVTLICLVIFRPLLTAGQPAGWTPGTVAVVILLVLCTAAGATLDSGLIAVRATGTLLAKNLVGSVLKLVALVVLIPFGVRGLVLAYGVGTVVAAVLGAAGLWPKLKRGAAKVSTVGLLRRYLPFSAGSYLGTVLGILPSTVVPLEVLAIRGSDMTARFAIAFQLAAFLNFIPSTMAQVLFAEAQHQPLRIQLVKAVKGIYVMLIPAVVLMVAVAPYLLRLFGDTYSTGATDALRLLAVGALLTGGNYMVDAVLISRDRTGSYVAMNGANAALVLVLVAFLLPHGLTAAAAGWVAAQGLSVVLGMVIVAAHFDMRRPSRAAVGTRGTSADVAFGASKR